MSKALIIIPVRMASKRLPGKPMLLIQGKSMIERVWMCAIKAKIGDVLVACCDKKIEKLLLQKKIKFISTRKNLKSGTDRVYEAYKRIKNKDDYDLIINLQGDLPFINPNNLKVLYNLFKKKHIKMATLASIIKDKNKLKDPNIVKVAISHSNKSILRALYFSRSQIPYGAKKYFEHIGVYGYRPEILKKLVLMKNSKLENFEKLEQLRALENEIIINIGIVTSTPVSIDTPNDLKILKKELKLKETL